MRRELEAGVISDSNPDGVITIDQVFDLNGNLTQAIDDNGNTTQYRYDCDDQVHQRVNADNTKEKYQYNEAGQVIRIKDPNKSTVRMYRDVAGNVVEIRIKRGKGVQGTSIQRFWHDGHNNIVASVDENDPEDVTDDVEVTRKFDSMGRLIEESQNEKQISTGYSSENHGPADVHYPSSAVVANTYDLTDRLVKVYKGSQVLSTRARKMSKL